MLTANVSKIKKSVLHNTAQKMKFSIKDFFSKYDQIRRKLQILSHLLKASLMENLFFSVWLYLYFKRTFRKKDYPCLNEPSFKIKN